MASSRLRKFPFQIDDLLLHSKKKIQVVIIILYGRPVSRLVNAEIRDTIRERGKALLQILKFIQSEVQSHQRGGWGERVDDGFDCPDFLFDATTLAAECFNRLSYDGHNLRRSVARAIGADCREVKLDDASGARLNPPHVQLTLSNSSLTNHGVADSQVAPGPRAEVHGEEKPVISGSKDQMFEITKARGIDEAGDEWAAARPDSDMMSVCESVWIKEQWTTRTNVSGDNTTTISLMINKLGVKWH